MPYPFLSAFICVKNFEADQNDGALLIALEGWEEKLATGFRSVPWQPKSLGFFMQLGRPRAGGELTINGPLRRVQCFLALHHLWAVAKMVQCEGHCILRSVSFRAGQPAAGLQLAMTGYLPGRGTTRPGYGI
jgi:hypothetical protein